MPKNSNTLTYRSIMYVLTHELTLSVGVCFNLSNPVSKHQLWKVCLWPEQLTSEYCCFCTFVNLTGTIRYFEIIYLTCNLMRKVRIYCETAFECRLYKWLGCVLPGFFQMLSCNCLNALVDASNAVVGLMWWILHLFSFPSGMVSNSVLSLTMSAALWSKM